MFESQEAPVLVASQTPVIPRDFIEKIRSAMTPDVELLADLVRDRLNNSLLIPEDKKKEDKTAEPVGLGRFPF
ncbi:Uncharacterised protein [Streptococcus pneumoniae]|nr:Uncharacterised protein [Streptococcus pneumoniae]CXG78868.1 Uncharacterised protein [Streptococcus pneumoniae]